MIVKKVTEWSGGADPLSFTKHVGVLQTEYSWSNKKDTIQSPRFGTIQEACYWLVQFQGEEDAENKVLEGVEARLGVL